MSEIEPKASAAYYLLPIFLGVLGGIIGYLVLRKRDGKKARNCLIIGISITAVGTVGLIAIGASVDNSGRDSMPAPDVERLESEPTQRESVGRDADPRVNISVDGLNEAISFVEESLEECRQADELSAFQFDLFTKLNKINDIKSMVGDIVYADLVNHEKIRPLALELADTMEEYLECVAEKEAELSN